MKPSDFKYAESLLNGFVDASINRLAETGVARFTYKATGNEIKEVTGRKRLRAGLLSDLEAYFKTTCAEAYYHPASDMFVVTIDLDTCTLNAYQACLLAAAKTKRGTT